LSKESRVGKAKLPAVGAAVFGRFDDIKIVGRLPVGNNKFDFVV
jgi:hypothetical protein